MPIYSAADPSAYLALGIQSALGTPQVTPAKLRFVRYLQGNEFSNIPAIVDLREGGDGLDFGTSYKTQQKVTGNLVFYLRPEIAGAFFQLLPGGATWHGGSAPATTLFHDNHASFAYSTILTQHPGSSIEHMFSDVRFSGFTLSGRAGEPLMIRAPFTAITFGASFADVTPTYFAQGVASSFDDLFLFHNSPSALIDGQADSTIESFTINYQLGTEELQAQSVKVDDIAILNRVVDVEVTRRYQSPSMWQKIAYGALANVQPTTSVPTGTFDFSVSNGLSGANLREILIKLGLLSYRYDNLTQLNPDGVTVRETISARALHTASAAMRIVLSNSHASTYGP